MTRSPTTPADQNGPVRGIGCGDCSASELIARLEAATKYRERGKFPTVTIFGDRDGWNVQIGAEFFRSSESLVSALTHAFPNVSGQTRSGASAPRSCL